MSWNENGLFRQPIYNDKNSIKTREERKFLNKIYRDQIP